MEVKLPMVTKQSNSWPTFGLFWNTFKDFQEIKMSDSAFLQHSKTITLIIRLENKVKYFHGLPMFPGKYFNAAIVL